ncbi:MAG: alanine--tRNA ligase [Candidatus Aenigmarchaeota archaeon]|nr:alanine--tRNA ligase [Candidatus Aenigmarchaeota archaeon]
MDVKDVLREKFSQDPYRYYHVKLFDELGFKRYKCECGKSFWSLVERKKCPDSSCEPYGFIGNSPSKVKGDYIKVWKSIEKFFVKNGHTSVASYPTVCRWFPGLYFNIASITSFQRSVGGNTVFEFPSNPLIIPQVCLRFNDIPNVGVSGRHHTSLTMIGQHSMYDEKNKEGYWKDRCIELDWNMLTKVLKIPAEEIAFIEDVWVGPEAFGYSLEYFVRGLEVGNAVFTEFLGTPNSHKIMDKKIIDMGAGYERMVWLLAGTPTSYDSVFGPVIKNIKKKIQYDDFVFNKYSRVSSVLNADEAGFEAGKKLVEKEIGMSYKEIRKSIEQLEAGYAIADHTKSLLYAIVDGQLPNNVGGGYNLRIILRRALGFIQQYNLDLDLFEICKMHAKYLKPFDKRLLKGLGEVQEILEVEEKRYFETRSRSQKTVEKILEQPEKITKEKLIELYESNGITPEMINSFAESNGLSIELPIDIYSKISKKHMGEEIEETKKIYVSNIPIGKMLFYEDQNVFNFDAKIIYIENNFVVLDNTYFYGRSGGQEPDLGTINGCRVFDVERFGKLIIHHVENPNFKEGDKVNCVIDETRRKQLMVHHTGTHVINAAAREILGDHIWQHSALKNIDKARIDITHYELLDEKTLEKIEKRANEVIRSGYNVKKYFFNRVQAEKKFGFTIYQGGAAPEQELRIVEIRDKKNKLYDVEACGGIHCDNTKEIRKLVLMKQERIQDGIIRLIFSCGPAAYAEIKKEESILSEAAKILNVSENYVLRETKDLVEKWKKLNKIREKYITDRAVEEVKKIQDGFVNDFLIEYFENTNMENIQKISRTIQNKNCVIILFGIDKDKINIFGSSGKSDVHIGSIVSNICKDLEGKGGGSPKLGQGIGKNKDKLIEVIKQLRKRYQ